MPNDPIIQQLFLNEKGRSIMTVSDIRIRKTFSEGSLKAIVSATIDNCLAIHEFKIIQGSERLFVAMPSRKDENGIFRDIIHPINAESRNELERVIIDEYERYILVERIMNA